MGTGRSGMGVQGIGDWGILERGTCRCWALGTPSFGYWDPLGATGAGHGDPFVLGSPPGIRDPLVWDPLGTGYQGLCALLPLGTPGLGIGDPSVLAPWSWASAGPLGTGTITHQHILALEPTGGTGTHPQHWAPQALGSRSPWLWAPHEGHWDPLAPWLSHTGTPCEPLGATVGTRAVALGGHEDGDPLGTSGCSRCSCAGGRAR